MNYFAGRNFSVKKVSVKKQDRQPVSAEVGFVVCAAGANGGGMKFILAELEGE